MRVSRRALRSFLRADPVAREAPINLVPMIDILTVLVLYLLVGSIASHLAVLQLKLPAPDTVAPPEQPPLQLSVVVRKDVLEVADQGGLLQRLPNTAEGHNFAHLAELLAQVKKRRPTESAITLLVEADIPYDTLVQVMDAVRVLPGEAVSANGSREMFGGIAIGDAPGVTPVIAPQPVAPPATTAAPAGGAP